MINHTINFWQSVCESKNKKRENDLKQEMADSFFGFDTDMPVNTFIMSFNLIPIW